MHDNDQRRSKKTLLAVFCIVIAVLLGFVIFFSVIARRKDATVRQDGIIAVGQGDMTAEFAAPARVASGNLGTFDILEGTTVKEVNVRVGDLVKKGDILATFDATSLDDMLEGKRRDYESAEKSYREYLTNIEEAPMRAEAMKLRIAELEGKIASLQGKGGSDQLGDPGLSDLRESMAKILGNGRLATYMVNTVLRETGAVGQTVKLFQNFIGGTFGLLGSFLTGGSNPFSAVLGNLANPELMSASLELLQLRIQESMLSLQQGTSLENLYKSLSDSAESAYVQAEKIVGLLKTGWVAEFDGIIRDVTIVADEVYYPPSNSASPAASSINVTTLLASLSAGQADIATLLSGLFSGTVSGMMVEYYPFTASFMLGKYDIAKVSLDQKVKVTSVTGKEFDAVVTYISPVASEGAGIDLGSIIGGGAAASRGGEARITIPRPDESITIGLDVDVSIELETRRNVLQAPAEAILYDEDVNQSYVFIYNRQKHVIDKQYVTMGLFDGAVYEITEGLLTGQEIIRSPDRNWESGQKVRIANQ